MTSLKCTPFIAILLATVGLVALGGLTAYWAHQPSTPASPATDPAIGPPVFGWPSGVPSEREAGQQQKMEMNKPESDAAYPVLLHDPCESGPVVLRKQTVYQHPTLKFSVTLPAGWILRCGYPDGLDADVGNRTELIDVDGVSIRKSSYEELAAAYARWPNENHPPDTWRRMDGLVPGARVLRIDASPLGPKNLYWVLFDAAEEAFTIGTAAELPEMFEHSIIPTFRLLLQEPG